jgi:hypothetical protein
MHCGLRISDHSTHAHDGEQRSNHCGLRNKIEKSVSLGVHLLRFVLPLPAAQVISILSVVPMLPPSA